tara:strand:+ start:47715 stop:47816 length:102 start_codon:yes stop_codon:yes gene_type:complete
MALNKWLMAFNKWLMALHRRPSAAPMLPANGAS